MTPRIIWLARHGNRQDFVNFEWRKTADRPEDPGLSSDGLVQAHELGVRLKKEPVNHIFASPFLRTLETAHQVANLIDLPIKVEAGLGEYVKPQGFTVPPELLSQAERDQKFPRVDRGYCDRIHPQSPETWPQLLQRTRDTLDTLLEDFSGNLLLISHAASIKGLALSLNPRVSKWDSPLCGLTTLIHNGKQWHIEKQHDVAHISQPPNRLINFLKYWSHRYRFTP